MPVGRKDHQTQFPATPFCRTRSATRFGVPAEKVVATIETPKSHQGIPRPETKKSAELRPARFDTMTPTASVVAMNATTIVQSIGERFTLGSSLGWGMLFQTASPLCVFDSRRWHRLNKCADVTSGPLVRFTDTLPGISTGPGIRAC